MNLRNILDRLIEATVARKLDWRPDELGRKDDYTSLIAGHVINVWKWNDEGEEGYTIALLRGDMLIDRITSQQKHPESWKIENLFREIHKGHIKYDETLTAIDAELAELIGKK